MKENLIRNSYLNSFNIDDKSKGLEHLIIINTKCLVDDKIQRYVYIDNNRLKDELRYYNFYGTKPSYDDILNILLPLILSNTNIQKCEDEVVSLIQKYVKYLKKEVPDYKKNKYYQGRDTAKRTIEKSKILTKIYIQLYKIVKL